MKALRNLSVIVGLMSIVALDAGAQVFAAKLDSTMRAAERAGFSGVVRVQKEGAVRLDKGYGMANRAEKVPFTSETIVQIGSNTKDFTAVAILQLLQAGRLALTDSLGKFFPSAPPDKRGITIRQLMNHRSGFPLGIGGDFEPLGKKAFLDRAMATKLLFPAGQRESYSNTGFSLLAAIIEQVTGKTYDTQIRDAILNPLGLKHTGFLLPGFKPGQLAHGYHANGTDAGTMLAKAHAADGPYWNLRGNGGMLSTVDDMHTFYTALLETNTLMQPTTRALRFNPTQSIGLAGSDGVNFFLYDRFPEAQTEIIIASTNAAMKAPAVRRDIGKIFGLPDPRGEDAPVAGRAGGKQAIPEVAGVMTEFVKVLNSGNASALKSFITAHFASDAGAPTTDQRAQRIGGMHDNLGVLTMTRIETFEDESTEAALSSATQGPVIIHAMIDLKPPYRIHAIQVRIGG